MRNLFTNPSAPTVDCGVAQVDAVTDLCHLVAGFCGALDRHSHLVQPGLAAEPARIGSQRTTQSFGGVDSLAKASYAAMTGREQKKENNVLCYQIRQSFYPGEINATLLAYANKKIEELDTRRQTILKAIAELSVETISPQQIKKLSYYLDNWDSIDFDDKRKAADGLISTIKATSDRVQIEWKI